MSSQTDLRENLISLLMEIANKTVHLLHVLLILQLTAEEENQIKAPIIRRFEEEGHPYFSSARYLYNLKV